MNVSIQKHLSTFDGLSLVVGLVLGIGIFQVSPIVAANSGSEFIFYSIWIVGALLSLAGVLCYAELASTYPYNGGDYYFLTKAYGPTLRFSYGFAQLVLIRPGSIAAVSFPFASYFKVFYPQWLQGIPDIVICGIAILILTLLNTGKAVWGSGIQRFFSSISYLLLVGIAIISVIGSGERDIVEIKPPEFNYGLALILVLFCYGGWSELAVVAGEIIQPRKKYYDRL